jgi:hypothetical protein
MLIEKLLIDAGALNISKQINQTTKMVDGIIFQIRVNSQLLLFKLPANVDKCFKRLWREVKQPTATREANTLEQAKRTAWKLLYDWVSVQVSLIEIDQVDLMEVFLPYAYNGQEDKTYYQLLKENQFKQLTGGK